MNKKLGQSIPKEIGSLITIILVLFIGTIVLSNIVQVTEDPLNIMETWKGIVVILLLAIPGFGIVLKILQSI